MFLLSCGTPSYRNARFTKPAQNFVRSADCKALGSIGYRVPKQISVMADHSVHHTTVTLLERALFDKAISLQVSYLVKRELTWGCLTKK